MSQPFNITITVPSSNPEKLRLISKTNRLSQGLVFRRDDLAEIVKTREELNYTGVYLLIGGGGVDALPEVYIGEGDPVLDRLKQHNRDNKKEFWEWTIVFVHRDNSLHKSHMQYLESSLCERALLNKRCYLHNSVMPRDRGYRKLFYLRQMTF